MLTKIAMWKNNYRTSGFEMTFEPYPPEEFTGWPAETYMFGNEEFDWKYEEIYFQNDLARIEICLNIGGSSIHSDFEGFRFFELDGTYQELSPDCDAWYEFDLRNNRLIGFNITESDYVNDWRNIRVMTAIVDQAASPYCSTLTLSLTGDTDLQFFHDQGTIEFIPVQGL